MTADTDTFTITITEGGPAAPEAAEPRNYRQEAATNESKAHFAARDARLGLEWVQSQLSQINGHWSEARRYAKQAADAAEVAVASDAKASGIATDAAGTGNGWVVDSAHEVGWYRRDAVQSARRAQALVDGFRLAMAATAAPSGEVEQPPSKGGAAAKGGTP